MSLTFVKASPEAMADIIFAHFVYPTLRIVLEEAFRDASSEVRSNVADAFKQGYTPPSDEEIRQQVDDVLKQALAYQTRTRDLMIAARGGGFSPNDVIDNLRERLAESGGGQDRLPHELGFQSAHEIAAVSDLVFSRGGGRTADIPFDMMQRGILALEKKALEFILIDNPGVLDMASHQLVRGVLGPTYTYLLQATGLQTHGVNGIRRRLQQQLDGNLIVTRELKLLDEITTATPMVGTTLLADAMASSPLSMIIQNLDRRGDDSARQLLSGEMHIPRMNYAGPGTRIDTLFARHFPPNGAVDAASRTHDLHYEAAGKLSGEDRLGFRRAADLEYLKALDALPEGTPWRGIASRAIRLKVMFEDRDPDTAALLFPGLQGAYSATPISLPAPEELIPLNNTKVNTSTSTSFWAGFHFGASGDGLPDGAVIDLGDEENVTTHLHNASAGLNASNTTTSISRNAAGSVIEQPRDFLQEISTGLMYAGMTEAAWLAMGHVFGDSRVGILAGPGGAGGRTGFGASAAGVATGLISGAALLGGAALRFAGNPSSAAFVENAAAAALGAGLGDFFNAWSRGVAIGGPAALTGVIGRSVHRGGQVALGAAAGISLLEAKRAFVDPIVNGVRAASERFGIAHEPQVIREFFDRHVVDSPPGEATGEALPGGFSRFIRAHQNTFRSIQPGGYRKWRLRWDKATAMWILDSRP